MNTERQCYKLLYINFYIATNYIKIERILGHTIIKQNLSIKKLFLTSNRAFKDKTLIHLLFKKNNFNISLASYEMSRRRSHQKQGQTVHKLQITTLWDIYTYIPLARHIYIEN